MQIEILLYDGFDDLDACGPFEVLRAAGNDVALVTEDGSDTVTSAYGARMQPDRQLSEAPELLVVPGGGWQSRAPQGAWAQARRGVLPAALAKRAAAGSTVAAVCTGAMLLARAGLLTGRPATTHHRAYADLEAEGARVIRNVRVVDDSTLLTCGGVTSGIDLAIWLVEREQGADVARKLEQGLEYRRQGSVWRAAEAEGARTAAAPRGRGTARIPEFPDTPLARAARAHVERLEAPYLYNHSVRSYLFASLSAGRRGVAAGADYDDEVLFLACLMHDVGLTEGADRGQRFELDGADAAAEYLLAQGMAADRTQVVWEAIALHSTPDIPERRSLEVALTRTGIGADFGRGTETVSDELAAAIHAGFPRLDMARALVTDIVAQAQANPAKAPPYAVPGELVRERAEPPFISRIELMAANSRWGS